MRELVCLIGQNSSGKTALMMALARMFSENHIERGVTASDFYLGKGEALDAAAKRRLFIEAKLAFPELETDNPSAVSIPECFNQMIVDDPGGTPYCRIRLAATWENDGTPEGDIEQQISWVRLPWSDIDVQDEQLKKVRATERARIQVVYVPATRDAAALSRSTSTAAFGKIFRGLDWSSQTEVLERQLLTLKENVDRIPGVSKVNENVQSAWRAFYDGSVNAHVAFGAIDTDPSRLVSALEPSFSPDEQGRANPSSRLSDGLLSLFTLSLPLGLFKLADAIRSAPEGAGFHVNVAASLPSLMIFVVEEPENHLAPHYLGKVVAALNAISGLDGCQVVISSHSPSILKRIQPDQVRYFLGGETRPHSEVKSITLPEDDTDEAFKYVREAVRGYPELYFSRLVILGEGPSEEIVLKGLFEESGAPLDSYFISVVPLGGRHVNHFWRLLHDLQIPFLTLLDLDKEKANAGWGRLQYVRDKLVALHGVSSDKLVFKDRHNCKKSLADSYFNDLDAKSVISDSDELAYLVKVFERSYDVFFSSPLDLDLCMLKSFNEAYTNQAPASGGPRIPDDAAAREEALGKCVRQVLRNGSSDVPDDLG
jgi:predicted ATP-dependent endonuclease of OLD family